MKTESEMKIDQYQSYKDFAEDTEIRKLLSLLVSLPADAFLRACVHRRFKSVAA